MSMVVMAAISVVSYRSITLLNNDAREVAQSLGESIRLEALMSHITDAETGQRGFIITGDEAFLAPYTQALMHIDREFAELLDSKQDDAPQRARLTALRPIIDERLERIAISIKIMREEGPEAAMARIQSGVGKKLQDRIRTRVNELKEAESVRFKEQIKASEASASSTHLIIVVGGAMSAALLIISLIMVARESKARRRAEAAMVIGQHQFRQVVESAPNAIVMIGENGLIDLANLKAEADFGYTRDELLGQPIEILLPERFQQHHPLFRGLFFSSAMPRAMGKGRDLYGKRKDGVEFPIEIGLNPIVTAEGVKVLSAIVDVSERKRIEIRQSQFINELTRINDELNSFAYVASHDLKSPLRGIDQLATWIIEDLGENISAETREHLRLMRNRIKRLEMLLDDLLAYSRVGRGSGKLELVDTRALVIDVVALLAPTIPLDLQCSEFMPTFLTRRVPLELVFRNLINNAIKHHDKPRANISVAAWQSDNAIQFSVRDDGPGIHPDHHERVFGMFQSLSSRDDKEGSGMGLAMVKKAVESVGGRVVLSSDGHNGSTFQFTWPTGIEENLI